MELPYYNLKKSKVKSKLKRTDLSESLWDITCLIIAVFFWRMDLTVPFNVLSFTGFVWGQLSLVLLMVSSKMIKLN